MLLRPQREFQLTTPSREGERGKKQQGGAASKMQIRFLLRLLADARLPRARLIGLKEGKDCGTNTMSVVSLQLFNINTDMTVSAGRRPNGNTLLHCPEASLINYDYNQGRR